MSDAYEASLMWRAENAIDEAETDALDVVDELIYLSYRHQRIHAPRIAASSWEPLFPQWELFEERFQSERAERMD